MKYINIDECLAQIDEARIDRSNHANVYLCRTSSEVILQFAYSRDKQDHIVLKQASVPSDGKAYEEIWVEYLAVSMFIEHSYRVPRFVDDVRGRRNIVKITVIPSRENGYIQFDIGERDTLGTKQPCKRPRTGSTPVFPFYIKRTEFRYKNNI